MADETQSQIAGIEMPEDLSALDAKALSSLKEKVAKAGERLNAKEHLTADELSDLTALADAMDGIRQAEQVHVQAQKEANEARESAAKRLAAEAADDTDKGEEVAPEDKGDEAPAADESATDAGDEAPTVEAVVETETPDGEKGEAPVAEQEAAQTVIEALAASLKGSSHGATRTAPRPVPAGRTQVKERDFDGVSIVASSGIPDVQQGIKLDRDGLSVAVHGAARMLTDQKGKGKGALVASIKLDTPKNDVSDINGDTAIRAAWDAAHDVQSMVASGGWCSPSDTIYDFVCDFEAAPEVLDLPSITSTRGGLRYPTSPLLGDVMDDVTSGFTWTEADDIAAAEPGGPTKPCFTIPCPDFDEVRLQAQGICVTAGNLTDRAYPELTNRYVDLVMAAHAHRMNALTIAKVAAASTLVAPAVEAADLSATEAVLGAVELQIARSRDQYFMSAEQILEVVLPRWIRTVIRRDLARRAGVSFEQVSNADITAFFAEIGARVQFVSDWQSLRVAGAFAGQASLPVSVIALIYPAGAHTRLDGGSIDLGVVRDSTLNATNDYTAAWTEEFWQVLSRCFSLRVVIPLCANGWTGGPNEIACPTA